MATNLNAGDRVRVSHEHPWAAGAEGTIACPPGPLGHQGHLTTFRRDDGTLRVSYWVRFDKDVRDEEGGRIGWAAIPGDDLELA